MARMLSRVVAYRLALTLGWVHAMPHICWIHASSSTPVRPSSTLSILSLSTPMTTDTQIPSTICHTYNLKTLLRPPLNSPPKIASAHTTIILLLPLGVTNEPLCCRLVLVSTSHTTMSGFLKRKSPYGSASPAPAAARGASAPVKSEPDAKRARGENESISLTT
jgi:hypothetical protein